MSVRSCAFLCLSKACVIAQAVTQVTHALTHASLDLNEDNERNASRVESRTTWVGYFMPLEVRFSLVLNFLLFSCSPYLTEVRKTKL